MPSPKQHLLALLGAVEGIEARPSKVAGGTALFHRDKEFAHFHNDHEIDLRLTRQVIRSLGLTHPPRSSVHPTRSASSPWIEIRFETAAEAERIVELVRIAIAQR